jgi:hypothetical protein
MEGTVAEEAAHLLAAGKQGERKGEAKAQISPSRA